MRIVVDEESNAEEFWEHVRYSSSVPRELVGLSDTITVSDERAAEIEAWCQPDAAGSKLLQSAIERLGLSARGYHRILKVARTIADMNGADTVGASHVAEAIQSRRGL